MEGDQGDLAVLSFLPQNQGAIFLPPTEHMGGEQVSKRGRRRYQGQKKVSGTDITNQFIRNIGS